MILPVKEDGKVKSECSQRGLSPDQDQCNLGQRTAGNLSNIVLLDREQAI